MILEIYCYELYVYFKIKQGQANVGKRFTTLNFLYIISRMCN